MNSALAYISEDAPYLLKEEAERERRVQMLTLPHIQPLADYFASVAERQGEGYQMPYFDPCDGGIHARVLFLLEAPGPKAVGSGFVSRNNPDPTARNLWHLLQDVEIPRYETLIWNIVPWYVGEKGHIRPVNTDDIQQARPYLRELLGLLPRLQLIVLVGKKAQSAALYLDAITTIPLRQTHHMSAQVFNISPEKKRQTQADFVAVAQFLREN
jgi:uracil-DNA glycosylase